MGYWDSFRCAVSCRSHLRFSSSHLWFTGSLAIADNHFLKVGFFKRADWFRQVRSLNNGDFTVDSVFVGIHVVG